MCSIRAVWSFAKHDEDVLGFRNYFFSEENELKKGTSRCVEMSLTVRMDVEM